MSQKLCCSFVKVQKKVYLYWKGAGKEIPKIFPLDWEHLADLTENIYSIARQYLSPMDYLFHHYCDSDIFVDNSLPQLLYLDFETTEELSVVKDSYILTMTSNLNRLRKPKCSIDIINIKENVSSF